MHKLMLLGRMSLLILWDLKLDKDMLLRSRLDWNCIDLTSRGLQGPLGICIVVCMVYGLFQLVHGLGKCIMKFSQVENAGIGCVSMGSGCTIMLLLDYLRIKMV